MGDPGLGRRGSYVPNNRIARNSRGDIVAMLGDAATAPCATRIKSGMNVRRFMTNSSVLFLVDEGAVRHTVYHRGAYCQRIGLRSSWGLVVFVPTSDIYGRAVVASARDANRSWPRTYCDQP